MNQRDWEQRQEFERAAELAAKERDAEWEAQTGNMNFRHAEKITATCPECQEVQPVEERAIDEYSTLRKCSVCGHQWKAYFPEPTA